MLDFISRTTLTETEWKEESLCTLLEKLQSFFSRSSGWKKNFDEIHIKCEIDGFYHAYFQSFGE